MSFRFLRFLVHTYRTQIQGTIYKRSLKKQTLENNLKNNWKIRVQTQRHLLIYSSFRCRIWYFFQHFNVLLIHLSVFLTHVCLFIIFAWWICRWRENMLQWVSGFFVWYIIKMMVVHLLHRLFEFSVLVRYLRCVQKIAVDEFKYGVDIVVLKLRSLVDKFVKLSNYIIIILYYIIWRNFEA
jgi:hypothetical protein